MSAKQTRDFLAASLTASTGWDVTADSRRFTFVNDDPPQVVVWTVTDAELGHLSYIATAGARSYGGRASAGSEMICPQVAEAIEPFEGARGAIVGTDLCIRE